MTEDELKQRTQQFALRVIRLAEALPISRTAEVLERQAMRSATSVGANYRAACRGRSRPDFISRIAVVEEEADESRWLELIVASGLVPEERVSDSIQGASELTAIFTASGRTAKRNR